MVGTDLFMQIPPVAERPSILADLDILRVVAFVVIHVVFANRGTTIVVVDIVVHSLTFLRAPHLLFFESNREFLC